MTRIIYALYGYKDGELDRDIEFETYEEAKQKFDEIKQEGLYSYYWGAVDKLELVKLKEIKEDECKILKVFETIYED